MPEYLVRLVQMHESFRKAEIQALADIVGVTVDFIKYDEDVCIELLSVTAKSTPRAELSLAYLNSSHLTSILYLLLLIADERSHPFVPFICRPTQQPKQ